MTDKRYFLGALLLTQFVLAAGLLWRESETERAATPTALLPFDVAGIERISISDGDDHSELRREGGNWLLVSSGLPANPDKVEQTLQRLAALRAGWPVATTRSAHSRFEVAEDNCQRRLVLEHGDGQRVELLLGTSPGFRRVHGRLAGEDPVFTLALNNYELPATDDGWLDKNLLAMPGPEQIEGEDFSLALSEDRWQLAGDESQDVDQEVAGSLAAALQALSVKGIAESGALPPQAGAVSLTVSGDGGKHQLQFYRQDANYYVRRDDREQLFTLSQYEFDRVAGVARDQLLAVEAEDAVETADTEAGEHDSDNGASG